MPDQNKSVNYLCDYLQLHNMSEMKSVQVRFPPQELDRIDALVARGEYHSRSEFIRDAVRKAEMILSLEKMSQICEEEGITAKELIESGKEIREQLYKEMFEAE